jgi:hypothetical protein
MRTIAVITFLILIVVSTCYAWNNGNFGADKFGAKRFGADVFGSGGEAVATYWNTSYTDTGDWDTAYDTDWNEPYSTEIP